VKDIDLLDTELSTFERLQFHGCYLAVRIAARVSRWFGERCLRFADLSVRRSARRTYGGESLPMPGENRRGWTLH